MEIRIERRLNDMSRIVVTEEGKDMKELLLKLTPFLEIHYECGLCHSQEISTLKAKNTKGGEFIYIEQYCYKCGARRQMGQYKNPKDTYFWKKWEIWEGNKDQNGQT